MSKSRHHQSELRDYVLQLIDLDQVLPILAQFYEEALSKTNEDVSLFSQLDHAEYIVESVLKELTDDELALYRQRFIDIYLAFAKRRPIEVPAVLSSKTE